MIRFRLLFCLLALACLAAPARADDTEQREFSIFVDDKNAGSSRMTIVQKDDGSSYMSATLDVKFKHLGFLDYHIKVDTQEWWKAGRLVGMKTQALEQKKKTEVTVALDNQQLRVRINGKDSMVRGDVWTNSYWKLADARFHNKQVPILEVDSGKEITSELKYVGMEKLKVGSQFVDCYRFLVAAAPGPVDLWYDKYHRLVRQEFTESGHKTIVQLENIRR
jgi:hypothetical protein